MTRVDRLRQSGISIWLDTLSRELLESGRFERLIRDYGVTGATSNPTIFERAISGSDRYDDDLGRAASPRLAFFDAALADVSAAAKLLRPSWEDSAGRDGYVSFQTTPDLAYDPHGMVDQALALWRRLALPNVLIKVPATSAGVTAVEELTVLGVNVNVTLLFSVDRYQEVIEAYLRGLERRLARGLPLSGISSVASFFVSRIDAKADPQLPEALRGRIAVANALHAYDVQARLFQGERWERLEAAGARPQRPLWASTGTKDPCYSDVLYVQELATPGAVNTMPEATLKAFADHGEVRAPSPDFEEVLAQAPLDLDAITAQLEREGVEAFLASYDRLLAELESRVAAVAA